MGSNQSTDTFDYSTLGSDAKCQLLTNDDIILIRNSWSLVKDNPEFGMSIMIRIFTVHSDIKHIWIFATKLETEAEMRSNSQLRYHAKKITSTLDKIINDMDADLSKNKETLVDLGVKHYHYGVKNENFKKFIEALLYSLDTNISNNEVFNRKAKEAWKRLMLLIADYLCTGIRKQEQKVLKTNEIKS